jgi:hypothetical protein
MGATLTVQGITYTITLNGGSYTDNVFNVSSGNAAIGVTLANGSQINVASGALSYQNIASGQSAQINVSLGGISYQDNLTGASYLNNYGSVWYVSAIKGGGVYAYSGSTVYSGQFGSGSVEYIMAGAADYYSDINSLGYQGVTGTATGVTVGKSGEQVTENGGTAFNTVDDSGGDLQGWSGGTFVNFYIKTGASATMYSGSSFDSGTLAGNLDVNTGASATGTLTVENGGIVSIPLADIGVQGSNLGAELLLTGTSLSLTQPTEITLDSTGILSVANTKITFSGGANSVLMEKPLSNGIEISAPCFVAGTKLSVVRDGTRQNIPVEELSIGDVVATQAGTQRIRWIGTRRYAGRFIAGNHLMLPVCFNAGSIADGVPSRDLYVSPGHAMCLDGVLIPAWRLINGVSVRQASSVESVSYFHVELEGHSVIFAENCPTESFFNGAEMHRKAFQNEAEFAALYPGDETAGTMCLPRVEHGFALQAIQARIAKRAGIVEQRHEMGEMRGFVERAGVFAGRIRVSGWVQDLGAPEIPVSIDILADGKFVARGLANIYCADVRGAGWSSGCCGYEISVPAAAGVGQIEAVRTFDRAPMPNSIEGVADRRIVEC